MIFEKKFLLAREAHIWVEFEFVMNDCKYAKTYK